MGDPWCFVFAAVTDCIVADADGGDSDNNGDDEEEEDDEDDAIKLSIDDEDCWSINDTRLDERIAVKPLVLGVESVFNLFGDEDEASTFETRVSLVFI